MVRSRSASARVLLLLAVLLTGCGAPHALNAAATPTSTTAAPPGAQSVLLTERSISVPGYRLQGSIGVVDGGLVFSAWPLNAAPTVGGGLYYYNYRTASVTHLDSAVRDPKAHTEPSSGLIPTAGGILTSGDIVVYQVYDDVPSASYLRAVNVVTGERWTLGTSSNVLIAFPAVSLDGHTVLFSQERMTSSGPVVQTHLYDLTMRTDRILPDAAITGYATSISGPWLFSYRTVNQQTTFYRAPLAGGAAETLYFVPRQVGWVLFTSQYLVWTENHSRGIILVKAYDFAAKHELFPKGIDCSMPEMYGHYMACQVEAQAISVHDLRGTTTFPYLMAGNYDGLAVAPDRVLWEDSNGSTLRYAMLPA